MQLLNSSSHLIPMLMSQNINTQIRSTSLPSLSIKIKQAGLDHLCHKKDTICHDNFSSEITDSGSNWRLYCRIISAATELWKIICSAVHKCRWLPVQSDAQYSWWGGAGAMLFTQSITLITTGVSWHLCQGGRTANVARGGVPAVGGWGRVRATTEGKNEKKKKKEHMEQSQMAFRK